MKAQFVRGQDPKDAMGISLASEISKMTSNAYSFDRYGEIEWKKIIKFLLSIGTPKESVLWVLTSKHMRWAVSSTVTGGFQSYRGDFSLFEQYWKRDTNGIKKDLEIQH